MRVRKLAEENVVVGIGIQLNVDDSHAANATYLSLVGGT
jgi:hypothetical protein